MGKPILYGIIGSPPVRSVMLVAKAINLELEERHIDLLNGDHRKPEYLKMNPQHTIPTLDDNGHVVWESHAINIYLIEKYAKDDSLYPKDPAVRSTINQRLFFNAGVLFPALRTCAYPIFFGNEAEPQAQHIEGIKNALALLNALFNGNTFLVGDTLTLADYSVITTTTQFWPFVEIDDATYPHINPWIQRVRNKIENFDELNNKLIEEFKQMIKEKMKKNSGK